MHEEVGSDEPGESEQATPSRRLRETIAENPLASAAFVASVIAGVVLAQVFLGDDFSTLRRVAGGALLGGLGWLLVMVGRLF